MHYVYVGVLMKVTLKEVDATEERHRCQNGHDFGLAVFGTSHKFCNECGAAVTEQAVTVRRFPYERELIDYENNPDWEDRLREHSEFSNKYDETIVFFSNEGVGELAHYNKHDDGDDKPIVVEDIPNMLSEFRGQYADMIEHIRPKVDKLDIFFGVHSYHF